jgi:hypothetical protein
MNEKPLERLNYFNGQRLQAADFKLEQDYHLRVRRWLNRSLYSAGIASGLQVYAIDGAPRVRVLPGLAIDVLGREIILLEEKVIDVVGQHKQNGCSGPYLTIRYQEEIIQQSTDNCVPCGTSANKAAEKGPARILADPVLELNAELPNQASGKIALACISLAKGCGSIDFVDTGVRNYIGEGSAAKVKQYALEGIRDLDADNPASIVFHIRGRQPSSVTLYLRSEAFPSMFYTETGRHVHGLNISLAGGDGTHKHELGTYTTKGGGSDTSPTLSGPYVSGESLVPSNFLEDLASAIVQASTLGIASISKSNPLRWRLMAVPIREYKFTLLGNKVGPSTEAPPETSEPGTFTLDPLPDHTHTYGSFDGTKQFTIDNDAASNHTHAFATNSMDPGGILDSPGGKYWARTDSPLTFLEDLQLTIDQRPVTDAALTQIINNTGQDWTMIGEGSATDLLATQGTQAIRVDFLVPLDEGEHTIVLTVPTAKRDGNRNGGRIHFNLYVE